MTQEDHLDELGSLFIEECYANDTFGLAIRLLDSGRVRLICRKAPGQALAKLLRAAADTCEADPEISQVVTSSQIN